MATRKNPARPIGDKPAKGIAPQNGPSTETRKAAGKKGASTAQASRSVVEPAPAKLTIAVDAPAAAVDKLITSIKTRGQKFDADIHSAALACLHHADAHGDITLMNRLLMALPKSSRRNALAQWAVAMGKFKPNEDKATLQQMPLAFDKSSTTLMDDAKARPFWDFKNVREGTTEWDFGGYMTNVKATLFKAMQTGGADAAKAKAMFDAISATEEAFTAVAVAKNPPLPPDVPVERRGAVGSAPATAAA